MNNKFTKTVISTVCLSGMLAFAKPVHAALPVLKVGSSGEEVTKVQSLLKEWGYFNYHTATGYYGNITKDAVVYFQSKNGLTADGVVGTQTYNALGIQDNTTTPSRGNEREALEISKSLRKGDTGSEVVALQEALKSLGYYSLSCDGIFGNGTHNAVVAFQQAKGLVVDGIVGQATCKVINGDAVVTQSIEMIDWSMVDGLFPRKTTATVTDLWTGKTFNVHRLGGTLHADVEPETAQDTNILKTIYTTWSWSRRPVIVNVAGKKIAASMNGMPHGSQDIWGNNYDGHFCIHFLNSRTHGGNNLDQAHQACVQEAYNSDK